MCAKMYPSIEFGAQCNDAKLQDKLSTVIYKHPASKVVYTAFPKHKSLISSIGCSNCLNTKHISASCDLYKCPRCSCYHLPFKKCSNLSMQRQLVAQSLQLEMFDSTQTLLRLIERSSISNSDFKRLLQSEWQRNIDVMTYRMGFQNKHWKNNHKHIKK